MSMDTLDSLLMRQQNLLNNMLGKDETDKSKSEYTPFEPYETDDELPEKLLALLEKDEELAALLTDEATPIKDLFKSIDDIPQHPFSQTLQEGFKPEKKRNKKKSVDEPFSESNTAIPYTLPKRKNIVINRIGSIFFWTAFIFAFFSMLVVGAGGKGHRNFLGYSFFEVLTPSMQSELPQGSLILTKQIGDENIRAGDDITFWTDKKTTVTHRVISTIENYENSGQYGLQTKGIENPSPDPDIVYASNVVGKVVWHLPFFGQTLTWARTNWWMCLLVIGGLILAAVAIKVLLKKEDDEQDSEESSQRKVGFA